MNDDVNFSAIKYAYKDPWLIGIIIVTLVSGVIAIGLLPALYDCKTMSLDELNKKYESYEEYEKACYNTWWGIPHLLVTIYGMYRTNSIYNRRLDEYKKRGNKNE